MKGSDPLATVVIIRQKTLELSRDIKTQFMKVLDILATVLIIRLHNYVILRDIKSLFMKVSFLYSCDSCDY